MATVRCDKGHNYDDRLSHCPYCPVPGLRNAIIPNSIRAFQGVAWVASRTSTGEPDPTITRGFQKAAANFAKAMSGLGLRHPKEDAPYYRAAGMPRVFISSTFRDLEIFREAAFEAIQSLGGTGDNMIFWSADDREPSQLSVSRVRNSDVLVLILAHRYGTIPPDGAYSITELEYREARASNVPILAFIIDDGTPWPPDHIDWRQKEQLDRFKEAVRREVTAKTFKSPEQLGRLITQAVANFRDRNRDVLAKKGALKSRAVDVSLPEQIRSEPTLLVPVGVSEDGLPMLLYIKRARDLKPGLERLFRTIDPGGNTSLSGLFDNIRQLLEAEAVRHWAADRIFNVQMSDGRREELYIMRSDLSKVTTLLSRLLRHSPATGEGVRPGTQAVPRMVPALQSSGGLNRHIGVSLSDGRVSCVGRPQDRPTEWIEWRPYLCKSIGYHFCEAEYLIANVACETADYPTKAMDHFAESVIEGGWISSPVTVHVSRKSVASTIVAVARAVSALNDEGIIHGDLKPQNVLLTQSGIELIDAFRIPDGERAPGWTPEWSAPEQVVGARVSYAADIYPLGVMVSRLLDADLVGEVRHYVTPTWPAGTSWHEVLHDPAPYISDSTTILSPEDVQPWAALVMDCLRFDPGRRPSRASEFADRLQQLVEDHPPRGDIVISASEMQLIAAILPDGSDTIARVVLDEAPGEDDSLQ